MGFREALGEVAIAFIGHDNRTACLCDEQIGAGDADVGREKAAAQLAARFGEKLSRVREVAVFRPLFVRAAKIRSDLLVY